MKADRDFKYGDVLWTRQENDPTWVRFGMFICWTDDPDYHSFEHISLRDETLGGRYTLFSQNLSKYWEVVRE